MNSRLHKYVHRIAVVVIVIASAVLVGWQFNITALKSVLPGLIAMNPFTALGFIATASWQLLRLKHAGTNKSFAVVVAFTLACFVFATGMLKLFDLLTSKEYAFDTYFFKEQIGLSAMSQLTAFCFLLFGTAMIRSGLQTKKGNVILYFITPVFTLAMISFFGYAIGNNSIETLKPFKPMALHASLCFLALTSSFLFLFPENSITQVLLRKDSGGYIARGLLPYVIVVPFVIGYFRYQGEKLDFYDTGFGVAIFMVASILVFMFIVVRQSKALSEIDQHRLVAEQKAEQHASELERRNKELEQFAYAASHDMQEPLRKIMVFNNLLLTNHAAQLDEKGKTYLGKIDASSSRMRKIIDDLLSYSHFTKEDELFVPTDLDDILKAVQGDLEMAIKEKGATIQLEHMATIKAVPTQMHQLFYNLIGNALKFAKPGVTPAVSVSCHSSDPSLLKRFPQLDKSKPYVQICVADNGIGFAPEHAGKIFNLFSRLHGKNEYSGTGIGLTLCKKVAENHKGAIWAEGKPGEGAAFYVLLPES